MVVMVVLVMLVVMLVVVLVMLVVLLVVMMILMKRLCPGRERVARTVLWSVWTTKTQRLPGYPRSPR
jgi:hypothetical protein